MNSSSSSPSNIVRQRDFFPESQEPRPLKKYATRCDFLKMFPLVIVSTIVFLVMTPLALLAATACLCLNKKMNTLALKNVVLLAQSLFFIPLNFLGIISPQIANKIIEKTDRFLFYSPTDEIIALPQEEERSVEIDDQSLPPDEDDCKRTI